MTGLRQILAALDEAALAAMASPGLLRRAKAALDKPGTAEVLEEGPDSALCRIEAHQVALGTDGPAKGRCDCPATGLCRHVLMAVLHLRQGAPDTDRAPGPSARQEIAALSLAEIEVFAGADWPQAVRIASLSRPAQPEEAQASCVLRLPDAPGAVTFVSGGGLRKALFKGPEGRRRRFVAAAALVLGGHRPAAPDTALARVDPDLLAQVEPALRDALRHGLRGDPSLAQDRLFDLAVSARADAAPRLAALLRAAARHAGRLAAREAQADPASYLAALSECHALARALARAPQDPLLTGQVRRDYLPAEPFDLAMLGAAPWQTGSGARGLTIHGWDGTRFLASGPARAAGQDPTFSPRRAYDRPWWRGAAPSWMVGRVLHLPAPRLSQDGLLPQAMDVAQSPKALRPDSLPFHDDWQSLHADLDRRQGLGLRAASRPLPALIRFAAAAPPRFDPIGQFDCLDVADLRGRTLALRLPNRKCGAAIHARPHRVTGALIEAEPLGDALSFRLISLLYGTPPQVWNVTLEPVPQAFEQGHVLDALRVQVHRLRQPALRPSARQAVTVFADRLMQALCDTIAAPPEAGRIGRLTRQAEALGLTEIARVLPEAGTGDSDAVLRLAWCVALIRKAAQRQASRGG